MLTGATGAPGAVFDFLLMEYNVDEDGGEKDAGGKDDGASKTWRED